MNSWRMATSATLHCLTGCAIGEVLGMVLSAAFALSNAVSVGISVLLAFLFGYGLTMISLGSHDLPMQKRAKLAFASDTVSIGVMEVADNLFILLVPGAIAAGLNDGLFWWSLLLSLLVAFVMTVPVNRWLLVRGKGHAVVHEYHHGH